MYFSFTTGDGTSHFIDVFNGKDTDLVYHPLTDTFQSLAYWGAYIAYSHSLPGNLTASVSLGMADISNEIFQPGISFDYGQNALFNLFWDPAEGARLGMEYAIGKRVDKDGLDGNSNRISLLMYYDF